MADIQQLIGSISSHIPFPDVETAQKFLDQYSIDDQAALISALYIGRDHLYDTQIRPDYVPRNMTFDRYFTVGHASKWDIDPSAFARILFEKNTALDTYYQAFLRCVIGSKYRLQNF